MRRSLLRKVGGANSLFENAVAYYKLDETSGDAIDSINNFDGTFNGGVTQGVQGKIGNAYNFNGITGHLDFGNNSLSDFLDASGNDIPFSFSFWINPDDVSGVHFLFTKDNRSGRELITDIRDNGLIEVLLINGTTSNPFIRTRYNANITTSIWQHIVITYNGSKTSDGIKVYVNAVEISRTTPFETFDGFVNSNSNFEFGIDDFSINRFYKGKLDEAAVYKNRVLDLISISDLYNNGNGTTL